MGEFVVNGRILPKGRSVIGSKGDWVKVGDVYGH